MLDRGEHDDAACGLARGGDLRPGQRLEGSLVQKRGDRRRDGHLGHRRRNGDHRAHTLVDDTIGIAWSSTAPGQSRATPSAAA